MTRNYHLLLRLLKKWPIDKSKGSRCYGFYLRGLARKGFPSGNIFKGDEVMNHKMLNSLLRLASNRYGEECPYKKPFGASGFGLSEIQYRLTDEYVDKYFTRSDK